MKELQKRNNQTVKIQFKVDKNDPEVGKRSKVVSF
jgi:hypothetical protein